MALMPLQGSDDEEYDSDEPDVDVSPAPSITSSMESLNNELSLEIDYINYYNNIFY